MFIKIFLSFKYFLSDFFNFTNLSIWFNDFIEYIGQPHDNHSNRRELRRPMGGDEELARGMARMDPFAYGGGGQFSGNGGNAGGRYVKH